MNTWQILQSQNAFASPYFTVRRDVCKLPDGQVIDDYYVVEQPDVGAVFGLTAEHELILVEQYKHGIGQVCLELPAGIFDNEAGDPLAEARREFVEETGYDAATYHPIATYIADPSRTNNRLHLFAAVDVYRVGEQHLDSTESITVHRVPIERVFDLIRNGKIHAVDSVAGIYMAWDVLQKRGLVSQ